MYNKDVKGKNFKKHRGSMQYRLLQQRDIRVEKDQEDLTEDEIVDQLLDLYQYPPF